MNLGLPALDLPVSRTGLQIFYPPVFKLSSEPGAFHSATFENPYSPVLLAGVAELPVNTPLGASQPTSLMAMAPPPSATDALKDDKERDEKQLADRTLVDKFHAADSGSRAAGILPVRVDFPAYGPSLYLVSELTGENQAPAAEFSYQQDKKAGGK